MTRLWETWASVAFTVPPASIPPPAADPPAPPRPPFPLFVEPPVPPAPASVLRQMSAGWQIQTIEGWLDLTPGDWIIRGVAGEHYPCKPEIFAATYEKADE